MNILRHEGVAGDKVGEANQGMHQGKLSRVIELQPRYPLAVGQHCGLSQFPELTSIDEGLQNILLNVEVVVGDSRHLVSHLR